MLDTVSNRLYGIIHSYDDGSYVFGILNLEDFEVVRLELQSFEKMSDFDMIYNSGGIHITYKERTSLEKFSTKVIMSNSITNTLIWYDVEMDSLFLKFYDSRLTANQKEKVYKREHDTIEKFEAEQSRLKQEINFLPPFWDEKSQRFYRLSYQELPTNSISSEGVKSKVYLTIYDKALNMMGEAPVPQLTKKPGKHFAKDGDIWIYVNIMDEMGFIRLGIVE